MQTPVIIGIAGGTGSGKTTVARAIYDRVGRDRIEWISHDSYYRNFDGLSHEERTKINFDHPDSLETELLVRHLDVLAKGSSVDVPKYDFAAHARGGAQYDRPSILVRHAHTSLRRRRSRAQSSRSWTAAVTLRWTRRSTSRSSGETAPSSSGSIGGPMI